MFVVALELTHVYNMSKLQDTDEKVGVFNYLSPDEKNVALVALDEWTHVNCLSPSAPEYLHDKTLLKLIYSYTHDNKDNSMTICLDIDSEPKRMNSLLDAIDISKISKPDEVVYNCY
jgi:hypothetical protein